MQLHTRGTRQEMLNKAEMTRACFKTMSSTDTMRHRWLMDAEIVEIIKQKFKIPIGFKLDKTSLNRSILSNHHRQKLNFGLWQKLVNWHPCSI